MNKNKNETPNCSIIILNYNGALVIEQTIQSVLNLNYPQEKVEIIIVDNNSKDESKKVISQLSQKYPKRMKSIFSTENLGFSKGNNVGIKAASGELILLLNNDCIVNEDWLSELVKTAKDNPGAFAITSKIYLYPKFVTFTLEIKDNFVPSYNYLVESALLSFTKQKKIELNVKFIKPGTYEYEIPYDPYADSTILVDISFLDLLEEGVKNKNPILKMTGIQASNIINQANNEKTQTISIQLDTTKINHAKDKIQNAGILIFPSGEGRDIGAVVRYQRQNYEYDVGQYNNQKEIYAACGAACMYKKSILKKVGLLDEDFFMYYEDVELCERARSYGFKTIYAPKAKVRHIHALSSGENSPFFIYHVQRGRFLHMLYHFPLSIYFFTLLKFSLTAFARLIKISGLKTNLQYIKVCFNQVIQFPHHYRKRIRLSQKSLKNNRQTEYKKITNGLWINQ